MRTGSDPYSTAHGEAAIALIRKWEQGDSNAQLCRALASAWETAGGTVRAAGVDDIAPHDSDHDSEQGEADGKEDLAAEGDDALDEEVDGLSDLYDEDDDDIGDRKDDDDEDDSEFWDEDYASEGE